MILLLAGLQGIPREIEEAAAIDGAIALAGDPLRDPAAARPDHPGLGVPLDHRLAPAVRPRLGHDPRRAGQRLEHDGGVHVRPGLRALPVRLRERGRRDPVPHLLRPRPRLPALGPAPRHGRSRRPMAEPTTPRPGTRATSADRDPRAGSGGQPARSCAYVVLLAVAAVIVIPIAVRGPRRLPRRAQLAANPVGLPDPWVWTNYTDSLDARPASGSSSATARSSPAISTVVVGPVRGARGVRLRPARVPRSRGRRTRCSRSGCCSRSTVAILPLLILVRDLGLLDNPLGLALPEAAFALPLTIIILRPFFRSIPKELEDAAAIDGCGPLGFFFRILLPLSRAGPRHRRACSPSCPAGTSSCCRW